MEMWAFIFWFSNSFPARQVAVQTEDACILLAKTVTKGLPVDGMCVSEMSGRVFWFSQGRQVERP
jgi:hypothetical protein